MNAVDRSSPDQTVTIYQATSAWTEQSLVSTPSLGSAMALTNFYSFTAASWFTIDLTPSTVQGWLNTPANNNGMLMRTALTDPGYTSGSQPYPYRVRAFFASKEDTNVTRRPKLTITYTPPGSPNVRPLVGITSPTNNVVVAPGAGVPITVSASDPDGTVTNVRLYANSTLIVQTNSAAFTYTWMNLQDGSTSLTAVAYDSGGASSTSAAVTVRTRSTVYLADMNSNPGWTLEGSWGYGKPTGNGPSSYGGGYPDPSSGYTGSNVVGYLLTGCFSTLGSPAYATTPAIDCRAYTNLSLEFCAWLGSFLDSGKVQVQVSSDTTNWTAVWSNSGGYSGAGWWYTSCDLNAYASRVSAFTIRWAQMDIENFGYNFCGWNVDDVRIVGTPVSQAMHNTPATLMTDTSAVLNAWMIGLGTTNAVRVYWNTVNGGTNASLWTNSAVLGAWTNASLTNLSYTATSLRPSTQYYFTFCASNPAGLLWAGNVLNFMTAGPPAVSNTAPTNTAAGVTELNGTLAVWPSDVRIYWGTTDGGTNKAAWANTNLLAGRLTGPFSVTVSNLLYGLTYYYRCYASNQYGTAWAPATTNFTTMQATGTGWSYAPWNNDGDCGVTNDAPYTVAVNFGGGACTINGVDFQASALSGANFSIGGDAYTYTNDDNFISGNSHALCTDMIYGGDPRTLTLSNLTPGMAYRTVLFSTGWGASQVQTFSSGSDSLDVDQNAYGTYYGIRISYVFLADATSRVLTITPTGESFYLYAMANCEAPVSRPFFLTNSPAAAVTATSAVLNATIGCSGGVYTVYAHWGTVNGGTNAAAWANSARVGSWTNVVSTNVGYAAMGLTTNKTHYFTFRGSNDCAQGWATNVLNFTTLSGLPADTNTDGIADAWASNYFPTNPSDRAATADPDGDGYNNLREYIAGANPTNRNDAFDLRISWTNGLPIVSFLTRTTSTNYYGALARRYALEQAARLPGTNWTRVSGYTNIPAADQTIAFTNSTPTNSVFYRARVWLQ